MLIKIKGLVALRKLRLQLQEDAGDVFPQAVFTEMLVLYDVCRCLGLTIFQSKDVLGDRAWDCITAYNGQPACVSINWKRVNQLDNTAQR